MPQQPAQHPENDPAHRWTAELVVQSSRFVRAASRHPGRERSGIALRTLSTLLQNGPMRIGDLAVAEHITQPTMTGVIQRMEAEGLLTRQQDPQDGRAWLMVIARPGIAVLDDFRVRASERISPAVAELSEEDQEVLRRAAGIFQRLSAELNRD